MSNVDDDIDKELYAFFYSATDEQELVHDIQRSVDKAKQAITTLLEQEKIKAVREDRLYNSKFWKNNIDKMFDKEVAVYESALKGEQ
jgi:hypothetical protein